MSLNTPEPPPTESTGDTWQLVIADMQERRALGIARYGSPLQPNNGRKSLVDLYQELLDATVYARNTIEEFKLVFADLHKNLSKISEHVSDPIIKIELLDIIDFFEEKQ